ncbi:MAG: 3-methyladenine DNA glycosylase AlkC [Paraglaciecola sp.]|jgi:3-methyladenine DNA glycosylase AlkC
MAEPLKNQFGADVPNKIARMIAGVMPEFKINAFVQEVLDGYDELELMPRGRKISQGLKIYLPDNYADAVEVLVASLGRKLDEKESDGMASFLYMPHGFFVADYGLEHFDISMQAHYELTQRFTAEFGIRPFIQRYPEQSFKLLSEWTQDSSQHVRRLVSEGTRPRLPWAARLPEFQKDPTRVISLLELLKDDPELYVRRSVANNLNDIGKDNIDVLVDTSQRWLQDASEQRQWIIRHALRSAIKRAEPGALSVLGYGDPANVLIDNVLIMPNVVNIGDHVVIGFDITNNDKLTASIMLDCRVHFVKANGQSSAKIFKLKALDLAAGQSQRIEKKISLQQMTTRTHYPGVHKVELQINGMITALGEFEIR